MAEAFESISHMYCSDLDRGSGGDDGSARCTTQLSLFYGVSTSLPLRKSSASFFVAIGEAYPSTDITPMLL